MDHYQLSFKLRSIIGFDEASRPRFHSGFTVEVKFPLDYPKGKPNVYLTDKPWPIHPNIWKDGRICLEGTQHWIPGIGVSLDALCLMIGEIIAYQEVNLYSRAYSDSLLEQWIRSNLIFNGSTKVKNPVDPAQIRLPDAEDIIRWGI